MRAIGQPPERDRPECGGFDPRNRRCTAPGHGLDPGRAGLYDLIINDKSVSFPFLGQQIREQRGFTLAELARRAGTSGPALHRYENGWERFSLRTLRRIGAALDARLEIRFVRAPSEPATARHRSRKTLTKMLAPLFWERALRESDLAAYADWVLERVLTSGSREQVRAARAYFGDEAVRRAAERRGVDPRTRQYWRLILGKGDRAPQSPPR